jgi:hypothetical protein
MALGVVVTFNPDNRDGESAGARMRWIGKKVYGLAQALKRRGQPWIAITIWQWPVGGRLHCHVLTWIEPGNDDVVSRFDDRPAVHVTKWGRDIGYFTCERLPSGPPEYENRKRWPRVTGNKITGQRLTISAALKALVTEHLADRQHVASHAKRLPCLYRLNLFSSPCSMSACQPCRRPLILLPNGNGVA